MIETGLTIDFLVTKLTEAQQYYAELVNKETVDIENNIHINSSLKSDVFWLYHLCSTLEDRLSRQILDDTTIRLYHKLQKRIGVGTSTQFEFDPYFIDVTSKYSID